MRQKEAMQRFLDEKMKESKKVGKGCSVMSFGFTEGRERYAEIRAEIAAENADEIAKVKKELESLAKKRDSYEAALDNWETKWEKYCTKVETMREDALEKSEAYQIATPTGKLSQAKITKLIKKGVTQKTMNKWLLDYNKLIKKAQAVPQPKQTKKEAEAEKELGKINRRINKLVKTYSELHGE